MPARSSPSSGPPPACVRTGDVRIGISGWTYTPWRGVFFPLGLTQKRELEYAAATFRTIEINGTFYSLQRPSSYQAWYERTPEDFVFSVKGSRYITHMRKLRDVELPLANFFASGLLRLGRKLGPILWQFPPSFRYTPDLIEAFFQLLPVDMQAAADLASRHEARMAGKTFFQVEQNLRLRHAMEIRHPSFITPEFIRLLRKYNIALVCADTVEWPRLMDITSDFIYCRLHGDRQLYVSGYGPRAIDEWAARVTAWAQGRESPDGEFASTIAAPSRAQRDVFVYFDNDAKVKAPRDAQRLDRRVAELLGRESRAAVIRALQRALLLPAARNKQACLLDEMELDNGLAVPGHPSL